MGQISFNLAWKDDINNIKCPQKHKGLTIQTNCHNIVKMVK